MSVRTAPDLRYTDRDVRENAALKELALEYAEHYGGEFEPMVRAYNMIQMDGDLTTAMARTVLNCMRHDENVASSLPPPKGYTMPSRPTVKKERELPGYLWLFYPNFKLKHDYVVNLHPQAKWFHKIDHRATRAIFFTVRYDGHRTWDRDSRLPNTFEVYELRGMCGKRLTINWNNLETVPTFEVATRVGTYCPRCEHGHRDAGWKP